MADKTKGNARTADQAYADKLYASGEARGRAGDAARKMAAAGGYKMGGTKAENAGKKTPRDFYKKKGK